MPAAAVAKTGASPDGTGDAGAAARSRLRSHKSLPPAIPALLATAGAEVTAKAAAGAGAGAAGAASRGGTAATWFSAKLSSCLPVNGAAQGAFFGALAVGAAAAAEACSAAALMRPISRWASRLSKAARPCASTERDKGSPGGGDVRTGDITTDYPQAPVNARQYVQVGINGHPFAGWPVVQGVPAAWCRHHCSHG